eukprot:GHVP01065677.1.p1 GENE.GHVP01065677.1~~GHVP01065677.1.p1  ORF type:complete len:170 (-),score=10.21 GHVP01065677.1:408-917(-)
MILLTSLTERPDILYPIRMYFVVFLMKPVASSTENFSIFVHLDLVNPQSLLPLSVCFGISTFSDPSCWFLSFMAPLCVLFVFWIFFSPLNASFSFFRSLISVSRSFASDLTLYFPCSITNSLSSPSSRATFSEIVSACSLSLLTFLARASGSCSPVFFNFGIFVISFFT